MEVLIPCGPSNSNDKLLNHGNAHVSRIGKLPEPDEFLQGTALASTCHWTWLSPRTWSRPGSSSGPRSHAPRTQSGLRTSSSMSNLGLGSIWGPRSRPETICLS